MNLILFAIPFFIVLIAMELAVDRYRGTGYYRMNDSISSLNAGIFSRVTIIFWRLAPVAVYYYVYQNWSVTELPVNGITWVVAFVSYDFFYYWYHRISHERNLFWAAHVVHHSSEEYNLTTALRQSSGSLLNWIFYLPMALVGIDPLQMATVAALNLLYQFWVHSRHIPKLGWYENWFVTPSNHRVHHAINDQYIDKNYGGVFIIWDRMFGTFQEEQAETPCIYGIRKPLSSWNPVWTNLHHYALLMKDTWYTKRWSDKVGLWFAKTGWRPQDVSEQYPLQPFNITTFKKFDTELSPFIKAYALSNLLLIIIGLGYFMLQSRAITTSELLSYGAIIYGSCFSLGLILENRRWALPVEIIRLVIIGTVLQHSSIVV
jgi:sterol desaturase/sphingolipid hydroxylase (fatty acid hydroxylase superfamily)